MSEKTKKYSLSFLYFLIFFLIITTNFVLIIFDNIILSIFGSLFLMLLLLFFLRTVIKPLNQLTDACEQVRKGNLDVKIRNHYRTEIGELISTFNKMVTDMKKSRLAMEETKDVLEIRVKARTGQLGELVESQEETIKARTKEMEDRVKELERFRRLTVDRELKMIKLKEEIKLRPALGGAVSSSPSSERNPPKLNAKKMLFHPPPRRRGYSAKEDKTAKK